MLGTIGYERASLADFIATLQFAKVQTLVDIRERAQSRRPGFSKNALQTALADVGIAYLHLPQLGDPKEGRDAARAGDRSKFMQIFQSVMESAGAQDALDDLETLASQTKICLMCFERDQKDCHRKIVADDLEKRLNVKAMHWGVVAGAASDSKIRRVFHSDQSAAA
jgi:uncharacterized protein (DUF488 family)